MKKDKIDIIFLIVFYIGIIIQMYIYIYTINPKYTWTILIAATGLIGFGLMYVKYKYEDNNIPDFMFLDHIVKYFIWIKKPYRLKLLKKNRYNKYSKGNKDLDDKNNDDIPGLIRDILYIIFTLFFFIIFQLRLI